MVMMDYGRCSSTYPNESVVPTPLSCAVCLFLDSLMVLLFFFKFACHTGLLTSAVIYQISFTNFRYS